MNLDALLKPYQKFGVHLGLERIELLLSALGNPHHRVPIIHVAGTNGKGSVCAYLSSVLTEAGYTVGRYTSPHLIDWTERICLNEQPISAKVFAEILQQIETVIKKAKGKRQEAIETECEGGFKPKGINLSRESPTQFEIITAAAWLYFAQSQVDIAVMEVGLGGRLDATNVCAKPLVTVITSISRDHWQELGPTIAHIAAEKAGILKSECPAVIGNLPPDAADVVLSRLQQLNCPALWVTPSQRIREGWAKYIGHKTIEYPLALPGDIQLMNSAIALATLEVLQQQGFKIPFAAIESGMAKTGWPGRIQWINWKNQSLLIDGAHNAASAEILRQYVDSLNKPVTWVVGMLSTKDHQDIFQALLRKGDYLYLVPVPDNSSAEPEVLAALANKICPDLGELKALSDVFIALDLAMSQNREGVVVLCGSLYLLGYFLSKCRVGRVDN